jgi:ubiquinone/menaquinone biosynthesis C-methylase UbiE
VTATDRWTDGDAYERWIGRWSRYVGAEFVAWLGVPGDRRWLDLGCGTGALTETLLAAVAPASVVGVDPSARFVAHARAHVPDPRATFVEGTAGAIPVASDSVDAAVAGLVLNFVPDLPAGLAELRRVVVPGGTIAAYVWDYAGRMEMIRRFFDAAIELDPAAITADEGSRFSICAPEPLRAAFAAAGFAAIELHAIEVSTVFRDFDDYWTPILAGIGPAPGYAMRLTEERRAALRERLRSTLPTEPDGSIHLVARAWAIRGTTDDRSDDATHAPGAAP